MKGPDCSVATDSRREIDRPSELPTRAGRRRAFLIGCSEFPDDDSRLLTPLPCAELDVKELYAVLSVAELGGYDAAAPYLNHTSSQIKFSLETELNAAQPVDEILIYYSGHGLLDPQGRLYLATRDTQAKALIATSLSARELSVMIRNSPCRTFVLILDCCYSGAYQTKSGTPAEDGPRLREEISGKLRQISSEGTAGKPASRRRGVYILAATTSVQTASIPPSGACSTMTKHIIHAIKHGDADRNRDHWTGIDELADYVKLRVEEETREQTCVYIVEDSSGPAPWIARNLSKHRLVEALVSMWPSLSRGTLSGAIAAVELEREPEYGLILAVCSERMSIEAFKHEWDARHAAPSALRRALPWAPALLAFCALTSLAVALDWPTSQESPITAFETARVDTSGADFTRGRVHFSYYVENIRGVPLVMVRLPASTSGSQLYMSQFEVTRELWRVVAAMPKSTHDGLDLSSDPSAFKDSWHQPVEQVSWNEVMEFCRRLGAFTHRKIRLPTEQEWEIAARGGTQSAFAFGETLSPKVANYRRKSPFPESVLAADLERTIAVGSLGFANAFGLFDMHGNVWEWTSDWYDRHATSEALSMVGTTNDMTIAVRGGSWSNPANDARSDKRLPVDPKTRKDDIGFRIVTDD